MLYHVSEDSGITRFEPRPAKGYDAPVVWAVHAARLRNYLLPRDCPRITYFAANHSSKLDVDRFLGASESVVAIEAGWLERVRKSTLYLYELPPDTFRCVDECAGYLHSIVAVPPTTVRVIDDLLDALANSGTEIRIVKSLWPLHDAVVASTLGFSMIRMRNALPR